jgi:large subunit ribosomal protein MRP49
MARRLQRLRALPFLADLKPPTALRGPSHLMRRNTPYRHVYRLWQEMRRSPLLRVESPLLHLPLHNLPYLYECWCALQVAHVLLELPDAVVHAQNLFAAARPVPGTSGAPDAFAYRLVLNEDTPLLAIEWQGIQVRLRYHPRYHPRASDAHTLVSLDSHTHIPDLALEWQQAESPPTVVVLDAKYRLDTGGSVPTDALADAYTYLGGIGGPAGQRVVCGAALLFPGAGEAEHHISGVSAIPLLPGAAESLRTWLWHMLHAAGDSTAPR